MTKCAKHFVIFALYNSINVKKVLYKPFDFNGKLQRTFFCSFKPNATELKSIVEAFLLCLF